MGGSFICLGTKVLKKFESRVKESLVRNDSVFGYFSKKKVWVKRKGMSRRDFAEISAKVAAFADGLALIVTLAWLFWGNFVCT